MSRLLKIMTHKKGRVKSFKCCFCQFEKTSSHGPSWITMTDRPMAKQTRRSSFVSLSLRENERVQLLKTKDWGLTEKRQDEAWGSKQLG